MKVCSKLSSLQGPKKEISNAFSGVFIVSSFSRKSVKSAARVQKKYENILDSSLACNCSSFYLF
jgi:hypothetical protein